MSKDLLRGLPRKEIRTVFGLPRPTYLRLQQRPLCSNSDKDVAVGKTRAVAEALRGVQKGSPIEGVVDAGSLKDIESRISTLEVVCNFYEKYHWVPLGPIYLGLLVAIPSAIYIIHGVYTERRAEGNN